MFAEKYVICHGTEIRQVMETRKHIYLPFFIVQWTRSTTSRQHPTLGALAAGDDKETPSILPDKADFFLAYATVPGYMYVKKFHCIVKAQLYFTRRGDWTRI